GGAPERLGGGDGAPLVGGEEHGVVGAGVVEGRDDAELEAVGGEAQQDVDAAHEAELERVPLDADLLVGRALGLDLPGGRAAGGRRGGGGAGGGARGRAGVAVGAGLVTGVAAAGRGAGEREEEERRGSVGAARRHGEVALSQDEREV